MKVLREPFGALPSGESAALFTLENDAGIRASITNYGGILVSLSVPGCEGFPDDVVLGFDTVVEYVRHNPFFGAIVGRFAGPVANARFVIDGKELTLSRNEGAHHQHGGFNGFDKVLWNATTFKEDKEVGLHLDHTSPAGHEGYPGNVTVRVSYALSREPALTIRYAATTDAPTPLNLTNHSYFNLEGHAAPSILDHELCTPAGSYNPVDTDIVPTGEAVSVAGTPMDFRAARRIGDRINKQSEQMQNGHGYDHNLLLSQYDGSLRLAAVLTAPSSGRRMEMLTTEPGFQFYTGNQITEGLPGKSGTRYRPRSGLCLEAQRFPNDPSRPEHPPVILRPNRPYEQTTVYRFSTPRGGRADS